METPQAIQFEHSYTDINTGEINKLSLHYTVHTLDQVNETENNAVLDLMNEAYSVSNYSVKTALSTMYESRWISVYDDQNNLIAGGSIGKISPEDSLILNPEGVTFEFGSAAVKSEYQRKGIGTILSGLRIQAAIDELNLKKGDIVYSAYRNDQHYAKSKNHLLEKFPNLQYLEAPTTQPNIVRWGPYKDHSGNGGWFDGTNLRIHSFEQTVEGITRKHEKFITLNNDGPKAILEQIFKDLNLQISLEPYFGGAYNYQTFLTDNSEIFKQVISSIVENPILASLKEVLIGNSTENTTEFTVQRNRSAAILAFKVI